MYATAARVALATGQAPPIAITRPTFVIAAHNEERVIGACLDSLLRQDVSGDRIIVVANGCSDRTAEVAVGYGVTVIDRPEPGKAAALNAGDSVASSYPRVYLDADIVVPDGAIAALTAGLRGQGDGARGRAAPQAEHGRPAVAGARLYSINERLPAFRTGLFGRGLIVVSEAGRTRFGAFPTVVADDLFLDSQFDESEKVEVREVSVLVEAPYRTRDLMARLVRVRRGNAELRAAAAAGAVELDVRPADRWAWLRVALPHPRLWLGAVAIRRDHDARRTTGTPDAEHRGELGSGQQHA